MDYEYIIAKEPNEAAYDRQCKKLREAWPDAGFRELDDVDGSLIGTFVDGERRANVHLDYYVGVVRLEANVPMDGLLAEGG